MTKILRLLILISILFFVQNCTEKQSVMKIAFGSCGYQDEPLPIFNEIVKHHPDLFIFLGDNIYGDTYNMDTLRAKYRRLASKKSFQNLVNSTEILATWDDHDYGDNDGGRHYPFKEESKEIFLEFFNEPPNSERRNHEGIYDSYEYKILNKIIQIILLDTRTFRDNLIDYNGEFDHNSRYFYSLDYSPHQDADSTMLGEKQWAWLDRELQKKADLRIIGSSTQFGIEYNSYEAWANFPHEQKRFLNLIKKNKTNGVVFISGDVHYAEISKLDSPGLYPIYDVTASGLSSTWDFATPNKNRIEGPVMDNHFGLFTIDFNDKRPNIKVEIWDIRGNPRIEYTIPLEEIRFRD